MVDRNSRRTFTLAVALAALFVLLPACSPERRSGVPGDMVAVAISIDDGQLSTQGVPNDASGSSAIKLVTVEIADKNGNVVGNVNLTPANPTRSVSLPSVGNPYTFTSRGYPNTSGSGAVVAYDSHSRAVVEGSHVRVELQSVLGRALLVPRYPTNHAYPGLELDLMLVVLANGYTNIGQPGSYLQVPISDFTLASGTVTGGSVQGAWSNRGVRVKVSECALGISGGTVTGLIEASNAYVTGTKNIEPFSLACETSSGAVTTDVVSPTVSLSYDSALRTASGSANDNVGIAKVQIWDGTLLVASTDASEANGSVTHFQFDLGANTFSVLFPTGFTPMGGLTALAFDAAGNQGQSGETANSNAVWVDASFVGISDGSETNPFKTIQEGINVVAPGGTVHVRAGSYLGDVTIAGKENVTLRGPNSGVAHDGVRSAEAVIDGVVRIQSSGTIVDGFRVTRGAGATTPTPRVGIRVVGPAGSAPILNVRVLNNRVEENTGESTSVGVEVSENNTITVQGNYFTGGSSGVYINPGGVLHASNNLFDHTGRGIINATAGSSVIEGNFFVNTGGAVRLTDPGTVVANNEFEGTLSYHIKTSSVGQYNMQQLLAANTFPPSTVIINGTEITSQ